MIQSKFTRTSTLVFAMVALSPLWQKALAFTPGACRQDAEKLCPGLAGKELTPCLKLHEDQLSMECKVNLAEGREMVREAKDACEADMKKFCAEVQKGQGRIRRCLEAHTPELQPACRDKIAAVKERVQAGASATLPVITSSGTK